MIFVDFLSFVSYKLSNFAHTIYKYPIPQYNKPVH